MRFSTSLGSGPSGKRDDAAQPERAHEACRGVSLGHGHGSPASLAMEFGVSERAYSSSGHGRRGGL
jgi:hypothetical protein